MKHKKRAYLVKSQEAYDKLMNELEEKGYLWISGKMPTETESYLDVTSGYVDGMCIYLKNKYISRSGVKTFREYNFKHYDLIEYPGYEDEDSFDLTEYPVYSDYPGYGELKVVGEADPVNHPSHYQIGGIETLDLIEEMLSQEEFIGYLKGNIIKYRERHPYKGKSDQDLDKAKFYWDMLQELEWKKRDS